MELDEYQQTVTDCDVNAVVSAGAGSGKTTVLARRFLRLIKEGRCDVAGILTLTFTRKAAAEMYERIYGLLLDDAEDPASAAAVSDFDKASISTLDSFCSRIARDCSASFGIPSSFITDETAVRTLAEDVSLDFILEHSGNEYLKEFIYINGFENVWKNFFISISMNYLAIGKPGDFQAIFKHQMDSAFAALSETASEIDSTAAEINLLEPVSKTIAGAQQQLLNLSSCRLLLEDSIDLTELKSRLSLIKLSKPGGKASKAEILIYKELVDKFRASANSMFELIGTIENRTLLEGLFKLTGEYQEELFSRKRTAGLLGFNDVLTMAVTGLKNDKGLRKYYKSLFSFIMIDEFQDNNSLQKELLYLLSEKDGFEGDGVPSASGLNKSKLFFVGDEKQSIYRFRGADVSVFKQLSTELESAGGVSLSLKRNYRSEPGLIDFFNRVFEQVMSDCSKDYQASFEALESRDPVLSNQPDIRLLYKPWDKDLPEDSLSAEESEANEIADYILKSVGSLEIGSRDEIRTADFKDFVLLFRSGTNQKTYEQVFRAKGLPYSVHSVRSLFQEAPVNDIYNLLQICIYPDDRSAAAAYLRSPLIHLSDLSVVEFLLSEKPVFAEGQEQCCKTETDLARYEAARELYKSVESSIDREPIADIVTDIWFKSGYRYLVLHDSSLHGYLEYFDYLRQFAVNHDSQNASMADFLDRIRENLGEYKKLDELKILGYSTGGVQMMPIHQSKGLEFPVVIIANAGNNGVNDRGGSSPAFISPTDGLSFNLASDDDGGKSGRCNYFYSRGREESKAREEAELRRLLYVALTRAENHLVISGCHGMMNRSGQRSMLNIFLSAFGWVEGVDPFGCPGLEPFIQEIKNHRWSLDGGRSSRKADISSAAVLYNSAETEEYRLVKNEFSATELNLYVKNLRTEGGDAFEDEPEAVLPGLDAKVEAVLSEKALEAEFGTLCHRVIELIIKNNLWNTIPDTEDLSKELRQFFRKFDDREWPLILDAAKSLASGFFGSETWRRASDSITFESELPFTALGKDEGREIYINGIIDLVFENADSVEIVDFKTDKRIIPGEYDKQMQIYINAAEAVFSKPARCSLYYLRSGDEISLAD